MKRNVLVLALMIAFFGFSMMIPITNNKAISIQLDNLPYQFEFTPASPGDNFEDFVDQLSDLYSPSDIGTHSDFAEMQDFDTTYNTLSEVNTGTSPSVETPYANSHTAPNLEFGSPTNPTNVYGAPDQIYAEFDKNSDLIVNSYDTTGMTGTISQVYANITYYGTYAGATLSWSYELDGGANTQIAVLTQGGTSGAPLTATFNATSLRASWTWANLDGFDVGFRSDAGGPPTIVYCDAIYLTVVVEGSTVYDLDLEVGWTAADYDETNEYLCIFGGTQGTEALRVDVWTGAWTNMIADLAAGWNNISVSSYLTDATFEIRFTDTSDDAVAADTWQIEGVLLHTWTPSYTPVNDQAPTLDNPSDTDNMYAQYLEYRVTSYVSDQNGFGDIDYLELGIWDNSETIEYCRFRYDEDTNTFTEEHDIGTVVTLNTGSSTATESGNDIDATFYFTVDWDFPDSSDLVARCYVVDTQAESDTDSYGSPSVTWDVETRLDYLVAPTIDDGTGTADRGDIDGSFSLTGTVIYYNSGDDYPTSTAVDVWVSSPEYGTNIGPWFDLTLVSGAFDVTCYADDVVGVADTYTVKVVEEGAGSGGADLYHTTSATDTYIADRLIVSITDPSDQRINIGENATTILVSAIYDYDDTPFDGVLTLNDTTYDYGTVGRRDYTVATASGGAHGVSFLGVNDVTYCIWDSLTISITDPGDQHINIGENATGILVSAIYDYDGSPFDGTLTLNNTQFLYGIAQRQDYTVESVSGGTHGITTISSNDVTYCIWDSLTISITDPIDQRQNVGVNATGIFVSAVYDYDSSPFDGILTLNNTQFLYGTAQRQDYTVQSVSGGAHEITAISSNDVTYFIWDSLTITITDPIDQRQNVGVNATGIFVSAIYDYDGSPFDGILTLNNTQFLYGTAQRQDYTVQSVSGGIHSITVISSNDVTYFIWDSLTISIIDPVDQRQNVGINATGIIITAIYDYDSLPFDGIFTLNNTVFLYATAQRQDYTVQSVSGGMHGITAISSNDVTYFIWDSLTITITDPSDPRIDIDTAAIGIGATAVYDYDGTAFDGTLTLNNTQFTYSTAQIQWYTVESANGDTHGITSISLNDQTWCIWDSLTITITDPVDQRQNVGVNATGIVVIAIYDFDGSPFDGSFTMNNTVFLYGTAQRQDYTVQSVSGGIHGITVISSNDVTYFIWDSLTISITDPVDQRQNVGVNATGIFVSAIYDYDGSVFDGTLTLNNTQFLYGTAQRQDYTVQSVSGGIHSITAISSNDVTYFIWDSLTISITDSTDQRRNVNTNATGIIVSAIYDYDGTAFDGTLTLNNTVFSYSDVRREGYTVESVSDGMHGITAISVNDETWCIWDQITVRGYTVLDDRVNINDNVDINVTVEYEYDDTPVTDGTLSINGIFANHVVSGIWRITVSRATVGLNIYNTVMCASNLHGISSMNQDSQFQNVIWDRVQVQSYSVLDNRVNLNENVDIDVTLYYDYDNTPVTDGSVTINGISATPLGAGVWQVTDSKSSVQLFTYDTVECSGNTLGITVVDDNSRSQDIIWDRVQVQSYSVSDARANLGENVDINVTLFYDYDNSPVTDGTVTINGLSAIHVVSGVWRLTDSEASVISNLYDTVTCSGNTLGITVVDDNGQTATVIWDRLLITIGVDDSTPDNGIQANFTLSVIFDFDSNPCTTYQIVIHRNGSWWHSFTDANKSFFVDTNSDQTYTYTVQLVTSESTYNILTFSSNSQQVVWSAIPNSAPANDVEPVLTNPDDGFMFARYNFYIITSNVSDANGYIDIQYVELTLYDNTATNPIWTVRYTVSGSVFSIEFGNAYIELSLSSFATGLGDDLDITWYIKIDWDHVDMLNTVPHQFVTDGKDSDSDYSVVELWNVETRLDYSSTPALSDDRGDVGTSDLVATGSVTYYGSTHIPLANETDVWVVRDGVETWSGDLIAGSFSIFDISSPAIVGLNNYTFKIVVEGDGSGGADLYHTTSLIDTFITDRLIVSITDPTDPRINIGENATGIIVSAIYDYDNSPFDGLLTLNDTTFDYESVGRRDYNVATAFGGVYGVSFIGVNDATFCIWDSLTISITNPPDQHINVGENATGIIVSAVYDYDGLPYDGTLTLNNTLFLYGTAQRQDYTVLSVSGGAHGITNISVNDVTYCIWDSLTITITDPLDQRQNVNTNATGIIVTAVYDYDGSAFDGTFTLNNTQFSYSTPQRQDYTVLSVNGGFHGITAISSNDITWFIWDSLTITITDPSDPRIDIDTAATGITATAVYDYDGSAYDGMLTLNSTQFTYSTAQIQWYTVESASGGFHGITAISINDMTSCIWDSLTITMTDPGDSRININTAATGITATAVYDYDGSAYDGMLTLNNTQFTYSTAQIQWYTVESASGDTHGISVISVNDVTYCIWDQLVIIVGVDDTSPLNGHQANFTLTVTFDYDGVTCTTYQIVIDRNATWWHSFIDTNVSQFVDTNSDITYLYNASLVSSESAYDITAFTTNTLPVIWSLAPNEVPVNDSSPVLTNGDDTDYLYARYRYYVITTSVSDLDGYADISYVELSLFPDTMPILYWRIRYTSATDTFSVRFGGSIVVIGTMSNAVGVGNTLTVTWHIKIGWDHPYVFNIDVQQFVTDGLDSASDFYEANWNIETRLDYSSTPALSDDRGDVGTSDLIATGSVTYFGSTHIPLANETDVWVVRDGVESWSGNLIAGAFSISGIGSSATVGLNNYTFKIVAEGDGSGGADLYHTTSLIDTFITDRIEIYEAGVADGRIDINTDCTVWWRARYDFDNTSIQSGLIVELNGSRILVWDTGYSYWLWQETSASPASAGFYVISASESGYELTVWFNTTSILQVIWDALVISMTDPIDQRIDVGTNATGILVSAVYAFDGAMFDGSFTLNNTNFVYDSPQQQGYTVLTTSGDTYGISVIQTNDATFCIWDRVLVVSVGADEFYHDPNDDARISVELQYEYDNSPIIAGTFEISGYSLTHAGSGRWEVLVTLGTYQSIDFDDLTACDAASHGISEYNMDSNAVTVYWDRIEFFSVSVDDGRINVGDSTVIRWTARLEDAGLVIPNGIVVSMTGDILCTPLGGVYIASVSQSTAGSATYSIISASLGEIDQFVQTSTDAMVIWDRVKVTSVTTTTPSVNAGVSVEIRVTLVYEFDDSAVTEGTVNLDNGGAPLAMTYNTAGYWSVSVSRTTAGNYTFTVDSVSGNSFGITSLDTDGLSVEVEWVVVSGFVPDTMTLIIVGGGAGVGIIGAAIVVSRRRRSAAAVSVTEIDATGFGVSEVVEDVPDEPVSVEVEEEPFIEPEIEPEAIEPSEPEVLETEVEVEPVDELVEHEEAELPPIEEEFPDIEVDEVEIEPELEVEPELEEPIEDLEVIEEPPLEPELEPEVVEDYVPEEFIEPEPELDLSKLTKKELLDLIPDDIKEMTPANELKRLTKKELISLVESFKDLET